MRARASLLFLITIAAGLAAVAPRAQEPTLESILLRASEYVVRYLDVMANLTAEERYVQVLAGSRPMVTRPSPGTQRGMPAAEQPGVVERREIRSDVMLLMLRPPSEWRMYRDVFEVDGRPVRDRTDRLTKLLREPAATARPQAELIAEESARFNISAMGRVLNEPGLPLMFLQLTSRTRFQFVLDKRDGDTWIVKYEERTRPTLFRHNTTTDNPSSGRFWINAATGEVTKSEHVVSPSGMKGTFTTQFRHNDRFGIAVPTEMREQLATGVQAGARRVDGVATYSNYRKFSVTTEENVTNPVPGRGNP